MTFAVLAYNQERFIREAVEGALSQTYEPLEIVLSDDCSTDRTFEIMQEMAGEYDGPHRVILNRNPRNVGLCPHVNRAMEIARGELVVPAGGDDVSYPHRTETTCGVWSACGRPDFLFFGIDGFSESGRVEKVFSFRPETAAASEMARWAKMTLLAPAEAWHRRVFEAFGPLPDSAITEDQQIAFRAALLSRVVFVSLPLVRYRLHDGGMSRGLRREQIIATKIARLDGFLHDLETASGAGFLSLEEHQGLVSQIEITRSRLVGQLGLLRGTLRERFTALGALLRVESRSGGGPRLRRLAGTVRRAVRDGIASYR